jgi:hypothetical protein
LFDLLGETALGQIGGHGYGERFLDLLPRKHGCLVQREHGMAEYDFGVEGFLAVGGDEVMQVECERRVRQAVAFRIATGERRIAPRGIRRNLVKKEIELVVVGVAGSVGGNDTVGRKRSHIDAGDDVQRGEGVLEDPFHDGSDRANGESVAHATLPSFCLR